MCSVDITEEGELLLMQRAEKLSLINAKCRKCKTSASVVLSSKFPYCKGCLNELVEHKFFSSLGKRKIMRAEDKVLVAVSGSNSSTALVHILASTLSRQSRSRRKLPYSVSLFYLDEGSALGHKDEERLHLLQSIQASMASYNSFPLYFSSLDLLNENRFLFQTVNFFENFDKGFMTKMFENISSETSKSDLLIKLRKRALVKAAVELGCGKIFTGETLEQLAVSVLSNIALGRGDQLSWDVGFTDSRCKDVLILRPMSEISRKEVAFYNFFNHINSVAVPKFGTLEQNEGSVQKMTEGFLRGLEGEFPSTVHTVVGSAKRLEKGEAALAPISRTRLENHHENSTGPCCHSGNRTAGSLATRSCASISEVAVERPCLTGLAPAFTDPDGSPTFSPDTETEDRLLSESHIHESRNSQTCGSPSDGVAASHFPAYQVIDSEDSNWSQTPVPLAVSSRCRICLAPITPATVPLTAPLATHLSRQVSESPARTSIADLPPLPSSQISLCYGCNLIALDSKEGTLESIY